ncbi:MAG TPA: alpha/beta hydrolase, partial [Streptosporangiaceae bacterium]
MTATSSNSQDTLTSRIEPRTQQWLDRLAAASAGSPPLYELSPGDARQVLRDVQANAPVQLPPAEIEDRVIPGGPTGQVSIRIVRPAGASGVLPVVFHSHGGGWILGDKDTHDRLDRELANAAQAVVVFVDYIPAPEAHYPVQNEQAYTALEWTIANAAVIGANPARVALVGDSVGGNMTAALTLMAKQRGGPRIAAQVLFYPVTDANFSTNTYERYADGPWLTRPAMRWFWDAYLPEEDRRSEITASPLQATVDQLRGLPPALVINGENDVLRAEGEAYARKLSRAGVPVTQVRYGGTIHDFVLLNPITDTPAPRAAIAQAASYLRHALNS